MQLQSKGIFIQHLAACEQGNLAAMVQRVKAAGIQHVHIQVGDGVNPVNNAPALETLVLALKGARVTVWGWHTLYGAQAGQSLAHAEATLAVEQICLHGFDGYGLHLDLGGAWAGSSLDATTIAQHLREELGAEFPLAAHAPALLFKAGTDDRPLHPTLPLDALMRVCTVILPRSDWTSTTLAKRVTESHRQYTQRYPQAECVLGGVPQTTDDVKQFIATAQTLGVKAAAIVKWDTLTPKLWTAYTNTAWEEAISFAPPTPAPVSPATPPDVLTQLVTAFNAGDAAAITALHAPNALLVTDDRELEGEAPIASFFDTLFQQLPQAHFEINGVERANDTVTFNWSAQSPAGATANGQDTLGLVGERIVHHTVAINFS